MNNNENSYKELTTKPSKFNNQFNLSPFYKLGNHINKIQKDYPNSEASNVPGIHIYENLDGDTVFSGGGKNQKINNDKELQYLVQQVNKNFQKICNFSKEEKLQIALIEFSIYDATDLENKRFYTYVYAKNYDAIKAYKKEIENNIPINNNRKRGLIIPAHSFYSFPYFAIKTSIDLSQKLLGNSENSNCLFVGSFKLRKAKSKQRTVKKFTHNFLNSVLINLGNYNNKGINSIALALPIIRPGKCTSNLGKNVHLKLNGGGIFIYGMPINDSKSNCKYKDNFNLENFILKLKLELLEPAFMKEAFSAFDYFKNNKSQIVNSFCHEIKHLTNSFQNNWLQNPDNIFEIKYLKKTKQEKVGRIEVWNQEIFNEIMIAPVPQFIKTMKKLIFLWTGEFAIEDLPFEITPDSEVEIEATVKQCWSFALDVVAMSVLMNDLLDKPQELARVKSNLKRIRLMFPEININNKSRLLNNSKFQCNEKNLRYYVLLIRLLCSIFLGNIKHMDISQDLLIEFSDSDNQLLINITNYRMLESLDVSKMATIIYKNRLPNHTFEYIYNTLDVIESSKKIFSKVSISECHSSYVIEKLLKCDDMNGKIIYHDVHPDNDSQWLLKIKYDLSVIK